MLLVQILSMLTGRLPAYESRKTPLGTRNDPFRLGVDYTSPAKGHIRLLLEAVLEPGKSARPARFSGRPLRDSPLASDKDRSTYQAEWVKNGLDTETDVAECSAQR